MVNLSLLSLSYSSTWCFSC